MPVDDLLAASKSIGFTISYDELMECVELTNDSSVSPSMKPAT